MFEGIDGVVESAKEYKKTVDRNAERLTKWDEEACLFVKETLEEIIEQKEIGDLDLNVFDSQVSTRIREISLQFGMQPYDENHKKKGGCLAYTPQYNGRIAVVIGNPMIGDTTSDLWDDTLDVLEPEDITNSMIAGHVEGFINKMVEWEGKDR